MVEREARSAVECWDSSRRNVAKTEARSQTRPSRQVACAKERRHSCRCPKQNAKRILPPRGMLNDWALRAFGLRRQECLRLSYGCRRPLYSELPPVMTCGRCSVARDVGACAVSHGRWQGGRAGGGAGVAVFADAVERLPNVLSASHSKYKGRRHSCRRLKAQRASGR